MFAAKLLFSAGVVFGAITIESTTLQATDETQLCGCSDDFKSTASDALSKFHECIEKAADTCTDNVAVSASQKLAFEDSDITETTASLPYTPVTYNQLDAVYTNAADATSKVDGALGDLKIVFEGPAEENSLHKFVNKEPAKSLKSDATTLDLTYDEKPSELYMVFSYLRDFSKGAASTPAPTPASGDSTGAASDDSSSTASGDNSSGAPSDQSTATVIPQNSGAEGLNLSLATVMGAALVYSTL